MKLTCTLLCLTALAAAAAENNPPRSENTVVLDAGGVQNLGIETSPTEETAFEQILVVLGEIEHTCESHTVLSSRVAGRIIEVGIHQGEFAVKGEVLARVESRQPGDPPPVIELRAPADGLVIRSDVHLGAPVEPASELLEIQDLSTVWAVAKIPQQEAAILAEGLTARIRIPALGGAERIGKYLRLGVAADAAQGTIDAIFELSNPGNALRPGMRAELSIISSSRDDILSIPRDALQGDRSNRFVFIKDYELENAFVRMPVTIGEISGGRVEITSGLFPGDDVVTRGSYALSFAGKGSASLKEALDAAHGHPHNEDGSEMTTGEMAASGGDHGHAHDHTHESTGPLTLFLAITCGVLLLLLAVSPLVYRSLATTKR
jgi:multidrug efflux pump subunit AcrA (membrane-fusion protein)